MSAIPMRDRLSFAGIDQEVREALRDLHPFLQARLPSILAEFQEHLRSTPQTSATVGSAQSMDRVMAQARKHLLLIAEGNFDQRYVDSVTKTWRVHAELGLEPSWFVSAYSFLGVAINNAIAEHYAPKGFSAFTGAAAARLKLLQSAISRSIMLDMGFALQAYAEVAEERRRAGLAATASSLEETVGDVVNHIAENARLLENTARSLVSVANDTNERSASVSNAAQHATSNVSQVATSTEQLGASITEIADQVHRSSQIAHNATQRIEHTYNTMGELAEAAEQIDEVISLISEIAEQTNLLALNATIESARAGEAGRGFAVVASEVKSLATQTAKATEGISAQIEAVQAIAGQAVDAITAVRDTIDEMSEASMTINAAIEEQSVTTRGIATNTDEAAQGALDVSRNITTVLQGANETGAAALEVVNASQQLAQNAVRLKQELQHFVSHIHAA